MYGQTVVANEPQSTKDSFTYRLKDDFQQLNERQEKLIYSIRDKLHAIVNKREPEQKVGYNAESPDVSDFNQAMISELAKMRYNTNKLEDIFSHLQEII